jgi:hypothetical protein
LSFKIKPVIELVATADLDEDARLELFEFCDRFSSRHRHRFAAQLSKDQTVFMVRGNITRHLVGFGTMTVLDVEYEDSKATIIYTGWTMISPEFRKHGITQRVGFKAYVMQRLKHPLRDIYWMMTSSTLNSYLLIVRNFSDSYPKANRPWQPREIAYVEQVLAHLGVAWNPQTGVIDRAGLSFYREGQVGHDALDSADPDIAFYAQANPGQAEGDTLVCLAPPNFRNFAHIAKRQIFRRKKNLIAEENSDGSRQ